MDTKVYEYLVAIAEKRSISRAAEQFYLSQPALSRHLSLAEEEVGAKLFMRQGNEMVLSDAGKIFINNAQAILHIQKQAEEKLAAMQQEQKGGLRIIVGNKERTFFARTILPRYHQLHPDVLLDIVPGDAEAAQESLLNGLADLAIIVVSHFRNDRLDSISLLRDECMLAVPPCSETADKIQAHGLSFDLLKHNAFILTKSGSEYHQLEQEILDQNHFTPQFVCEVSQMKSALHMVKNGFGNAFLTRTFLNAFGKEVPAFSIVPPYRFEHIAAYPKSSHKPIQDLLHIAKDEYCNYENYLREGYASDEPV